MTARQRFLPASATETLAWIAFRFVAIASFAIVLRVLLTVAGAPIARWYYLAIGFSILALLISLRQLATLPTRIAFIGAIVLVGFMLIGLGSPWNSRDRFLRRFEQVRIGMSQQEVSAIMQGYMQGTGIASFSNVTTINAGPSTFVNAPAASQLAPQQCEVYRHSTSGLWNADWGTVCYSDRRVVKTEFSPD